MKFLLHGPDEFRLRRKIDTLKKRFMEMRDSSGLNVVRLYRKEHALPEVAEALFSSPFLAERKMVLLEGFLSGPVEGQEELAALLARKTDSIITIFIEDVERKKIEKSPLFPLLSEEKFTEHFPLPTPLELENFLTQEAATEGFELGRDEARLLVGSIGDDVRHLHNELTKLCAYTAAHGSKSISRATIAELVPGARDADIFAFIDACTAGNCAPATLMLEDMLEGGANEFQIIAMLERQFRILTAAADAIRAESRPDAARFAADLGIHPFPAGKALTAARRRPFDWFADRHGAILEIERKAKTGPGSLKAQLGAFIYSLK